MNDLVKPSKHRTSVQLSSGSAELEAPRIISITNGDGLSIPPGGTTTNGNLSFVGSAQPEQFAVLLDDGIPAHHSVYVDKNGHFSAAVDGQRRGIRTYSVETTDGQVSETWTVVVDVSETVSIDAVYDPVGKPVGNREATFENELNFVGNGQPEKVVELVNNGIVVKLLNVGSDGRWSANLKDLKTGTQNFSARETNGQQSSPWQVLIKKPAPLSIQFALGDESYQLIPNQHPTSDTSVTFAGTGNPGETGWIVDYENNLVPFETNDHGIHSTTIYGLEKNKFHTLRLQSHQGRTSGPWVIKVTSSELD